MGSEKQRGDDPGQEGEKSIHPAASAANTCATPLAGVKRSAAELTPLEVDARDVGGGPSAAYFGEPSNVAAVM